MKKILFVILFTFIITFMAFSSKDDMTPDHFVGTWMMEDEYDNGDKVHRIWVIERNGASDTSGKLTTYKLNGEKDFEFTWIYYHENVYLLKFEDRTFMYYVFYMDENTIRLRRYTNSIDQFDLTNISNSQNGFPKNF